MNRDVGGLRGREFDLLVVGGGIYGAWTAYTAALLGLETALVEREDWASGTSSASSKLIHGGLRYLEHFRFGMVRTSLDERKRLARLAPHRVAPLRFVVPIYRDGRVGKTRLKWGLMLYDAIAGAGQPVAPHEYFDREETVSMYPFFSGDGLEGAFTYGDCVTDDARFTLEVVDGAVWAGAAAANYVEAEGLLVEDGRVAGVAAVDRAGGDESFDIRARVVVNAAGPWAPSAMGGAASAGPTRLVKGVHLVMPPLPTDDAMLVFAHRDRRVFFVIPWYGRTLLGTTDADHAGDPSGAVVDVDDVGYLLSEARRVLPGVGWDESSVLGRFAGVRALHDVPGRDATSLSREWSLDSPRPGLLVSTGGKFTSARVDAARIVERALETLGRRTKSAAAATDCPLPWCPAGAPWEVWYETTVENGVRAGFDDDAAESLAHRYGARCEALLETAREHTGLFERVVPDLPFVKAEIVHAAAMEMACTLEDIVRRRIPLVILTRPDRRVLEEAARLAGGVLGWNDERRASEVDAVLEKWRPDAA
jgi:glycerol-3-phosphate dehydrogenase